MNVFSAKRLFRATQTLIAMLVVAMLSTVAIKPAPVAAAACTAPTTNYGSVSSSLQAPETATYRIWSRMMAPDATNTSYLLEVDGKNCYVVGGKSIGNNTWTWVDYQNGNTSSKIELSLSKGSHSIKLIGRQPNVKLDRVVITSDLGCMPTGNGDNCNTPAAGADTKVPAVTLTAPAEASDVTGVATLKADASDNTAVSKVEFYANSVLLGSDTSSPYSYSWNSVTAPNGQVLIAARAYDAAGNIATSSYRVQVKNGDTTAPSQPTNVTAKATAYNKVALNWDPSADNVGVSGYIVNRNGSLLVSLDAVTSFEDASALANTSYEYSVVAFDAAGNKSTASDKVTTKTPTVADSQVPSAPTNVQAVAASATQINLSWKASTDNTGVAKYEVYRNNQKIAVVTTTSYGDSGLNPNTEYAYYVVAHDAVNNKSAASTKVSATTQKNVTRAVVRGQVKTSGKRGPFTLIEVQVNGKRRYYVTNNRGYYNIQGLSAGSYTMSFYKPGYRSQSFTVKVPESGVVTKDVTLQPKRRSN